MHSVQLEMQIILLEGRAWLQFNGICQNHSLALCIAVHLIPDVFIAQGPKQIGTGEISIHPHSTIMAETGVVPRADSHLYNCFSTFP